MKITAAVYPAFLWYQYDFEDDKYEPFHGKVLFKTPRYNEYFKENFKVFNVLDFIALIMDPEEKKNPAPFDENRKITSRF